MEFKFIDKDNWKRKEYFDHYFFNVPCTYSMTVKMDITKIIKKKQKLYPTMLYYITIIKIQKLFLIFGQNIIVNMKIFVKRMKMICLSMQIKVGYL